MRSIFEIGEINTPQDVIIACGKKNEILQMVLKVTREQPEAYSAGPDEVSIRLMENIEARQLLIDTLTEIESKLGAAEKSGVRFPDEAENMLQESRETLISIISQDKANETLAAGRLEELRQELKRLNTSQQSRNVYDSVKTGYVSSVYFDRQN